MIYLLTQIWLCILLAGLIGGITGWAMRGNNKHRLEMLEDNWRQRYQLLESERNDCVNQIANLNVIRHERNALSKKLKFMQAAAKDQEQIKQQAMVVQSDRDELSAEVAQRKEENLSLKNRIHHLQGIFEEQKEMVASLTEKLSEVSEAAKVDPDVRYQELENDYAALQEKLRVSDGKVTAGESFIGQLMAQMEDKDRQLKALSSGESSAGDSGMDEALIEAHQEIAELRERLKQTEISSQQEQKKIGKLVSEFPEMENQLQERDSVLKEKAEEIEARDSRLERVNQHLKEKEATIKALDSQQDSFKIRLMDADSKVEVLVEALENERATSENLNVKLKRQELQLEDLQSEMENKKFEMDALFQKLTSTEYMLTNSENDAQNSREAHHQLLTRSEELESQRRQISEELEIKTREFESVLKKLDDEEQSRERLEQEIRELQNIIKDVGVKYDIARMPDMPAQPVKKGPVKKTLKADKIPPGLVQEDDLDENEEEFAPSLKKLSPVELKRKIAQQIDRLLSLSDDGTGEDSIDKQLIRIEGITPEIARILKKVGIRTVNDLANSQDVRLKGLLHQLKRREVVVNTIRPQQITDWITEARSLVQYR